MAGLLRRERNILIEKVGTILGPIGLAVSDIWWLEDDGGVLAVYLHRVDGEAMDMELCVKATRVLNEDLLFEAAVDAVMSGPYTLEVSSCPEGMALRQPKDFERFTGQIIEVKLESVSDGKKASKGTVKSVDAQSVKMDTARGPWVFELSKLDRAWLRSEV